MSSTNFQPTANQQDEAQNNQIQDLVSQGKKLKEIAEQTSLSVSVIRGRLKKLGISIRASRKAQAKNVEIGTQINGWIVLEALGYKQIDNTFSDASSGKKKNFYYKCQCCGCGKTKPVRENTLASGGGCASCSIRKSWEEKADRPSLDESEVKRLFAEGLNGRQIAKNLGVENERVYRVLRKYGLVWNGSQSKMQGAAFDVGQTVKGWKILSRSNNRWDCSCIRCGKKSRMKTRQIETKKTEFGCVRCTQLAIRKNGSD